MVGEEARLPCLLNINGLGSRPNISWWRILQGNATYQGTFTWPSQFHDWGQSNGELLFSSVNKSHRGVYRCHVQENGTEWRSCGTYLRVRGECQPGPRGLLSGKWEGAGACIAGILAPGSHTLTTHFSPVEWGLPWGLARGEAWGGRGTGPGARALSSNPSSQSRPPDPSWTWGRAPRTTSSRRRGSSCSSALWCPGHCYCSG